MSKASEQDLRNSQENHLRGQTSDSAGDIGQTIKT